MRRLMVALATLALLVAFMPSAAFAGPAVYKISTITVTVEGREAVGSNCNVTVSVTYEPVANRIKTIGIQQLRNGVSMSSPYALPNSTGTIYWDFHEVTLGDHASWSWVACSSVGVGMPSAQRSTPTPSSGVKGRPTPVQLTR